VEAQRAERDVSEVASVAESSSASQLDELVRRFDVAV
jgi:hypothetical protein